MRFFKALTLSAVAIPLLVAGCEYFLTPPSAPDELAVSENLPELELPMPFDSNPLLESFEQLENDGLDSFPEIPFSWEIPVPKNRPDDPCSGPPAPVETAYKKPRFICL